MDSRIAKKGTWCIENPAEGDDFQPKLHRGQDIATMKTTANWSISPGFTGPNNFFRNLAIALSWLAQSPGSHLLIGNGQWNSYDPASGDLVPRIAHQQSLTL
jgi:hypothetical protein